MGGRTMTLRQLFVLVTVFAVFCAALMFAGVWAAVFFGIGLVAIVCMAIIAFVDRGSRQAYAIGFTLAAIIYTATVLVAQAGFGGELDPYSGYLPTTKLLTPLFTLINQGTWIDLSTGKEIPNYVQPKVSAGGGMGGAVGLRDSLDRRSFMMVGHVFWGLLFGFIGGYFGRLTYARRQTNGSPPIKRETQSQ
jgi:hypothetical protein